MLRYYAIVDQQGLARFVVAIDSESGVIRSVYAYPDLTGGTVQKSSDDKLFVVVQGQPITLTDRVPLTAWTYRADGSLCDNTGSDGCLFIDENDSMYVVNYATRIYSIHDGDDWKLVVAYPGFVAFPYVYQPYWYVWGNRPHRPHRPHRPRPPHPHPVPPIGVLPGGGGGGGPGGPGGGGPGGPGDGGAGARGPGNFVNRSYPVNPPGLPGNTTLQGATSSTLNGCGCGTPGWPYTRGEVVNKTCPNCTPVVELYQPRCNWGCNYRQWVVNGPRRSPADLLNLLQSLRNRG